LVQAGQFFCEGLQNFTPEEERYSVIWIQWVIGHLNDDDLVAFFERCRKGLRPGGWIVVKENVILKGNFWIDKEDSSVVRYGTCVFVESGKQRHVVMNCDGLSPAAGRRPASKKCSKEQG
jgi:protein N-terminal methyltransferase